MAEGYTEYPADLNADAVLSVSTSWPLWCTLSQYPQKHHHKDPAHNCFYIWLCDFAIPELILGSYTDLTSVFQIIITKTISSYPTFPSLY